MFNPISEKLLCMLALSDTIADKLGMPADAFWRGFVVQDRQSGEIRARHRFKYSDTKKNWHEIRSSSKGKALSKEELVDSLKHGLSIVMAFAAVHFEVNLDELDGEIVQEFYPPDDNGDVQATLDWLVQQDLVEIKAVMKVGDFLAGRAPGGLPDMVFPAEHSPKR